MQLHKHLTFLVSFLIYLNVSFSQSAEWTTETSSVKNTEVKSFISLQEGPNGSKVQTIEYIATTITEADYNACITVMKNTALHKKIFDYTTNAELLEKISESEWYNYYYSDTPWPLPDSDSVTRFLFSNNGQTAYFISSAKPDRIEQNNVQRLQLYNTDYIFTKLGNGKVKIIIKSKFQPIGNAPKWLLNFWFPDGPAKMIERLVNLANGDG